MEMRDVRRNDKGQTRLFRVWHARTLWQRLRGLIARPPLLAGEGLLISPCNSVHTIGMRYPLDLVFLDKSGRIVKCIESLQPYRVAASRQARHTLELPIGSIAAAKLKPGELVTWKVEGA